MENVIDLLDQVRIIAPPKMLFAQLQSKIQAQRENFKPRQILAIAASFALIMLLNIAALTKVKQQTDSAVIAKSVSVNNHIY